MPKAKNARYLRQKAHMSQKEFAAAIGSTQATIHNWETKKRAIPVPSAKRIAEFFGIDYADFCDIDLEMRDNIGALDESTLTNEEIEMILMMREMPDELREAFENVIAYKYREINGKE